MHLLIDGYGGDYQKLSDQEFIERFLDDYPAAIGMTKIADPHVYTYHAPKHEDWGVSGFVIIAESHISVHSFPERHYINIDVFSCKDFDSEKAQQELIRIFDLAAVKTWVLKRGLEHLDTDVMERVVRMEREQLRSHS